LLAGLLASISFALFRLSDDSYNRRMDCMAFLKATTPIGPLYVLYGDEAFLKRQALLALRARALGPDADEQAATTHDGETAAFAAVYDDVHTAPFFSPRRLVVVADADDFVTKYRGQLEKIVDKLPPTGCLVLDVTTWASNTRLAKIVPATATIVCKTPSTQALPRWSI